MPNPKGRRVFQFRFGVLCAALLVVAFLPVFRAQNGQLIAQQKQLVELQSQQYEETMIGERLKHQLQNSATNEFREREARQRYGYVMPGVIRFMAEEPLPDQDASLSPAPEPEEEEGSVLGVFEDLTLPQATSSPDKDWGNFE